jgi:hypothetical protein
MLNKRKLRRRQKSKLRSFWIRRLEIRPEILNLKPIWNNLRLSLKVILHMKIS